MKHSGLEVIIDVHVGVDDGALGFFPKQWPPGPVVVGAVMPGRLLGLLLLVFFNRPYYQSGLLEDVLLDLFNSSS